MTSDELLAKFSVYHYVQWLGSVSHIYWDGLGSSLKAYVFSSYEHYSFCNIDSISNI